MRISLCFCFMYLCIISVAQDIRQAYQEGTQAYKDGNYELFRDRMFFIDSLRPNYPAIVYNLAAGYALTNRPSKSIEKMNQYILMNATKKFRDDTDFQSIVKTPPFSSIEEKQKELNEIKAPKRIVSHDILSSHPESITYAKKEKAFYIGGVRDGDIWKIPLNGKPIRWIKSTENSWSVMGTKVSPDNKYLWVCTSSLTNYSSFEESKKGYASVLQYDLKSRERLQTFTKSGNHNFGDLVIDKKGNVYISDGSANKIYHINKEKNALEEFIDLSKIAFNLQGLTFDEAQEHLYVSDYIDGIYKLNLLSKVVNKLEITTNNILLKGIDGLYYKNGYLIGLHNGTNPNRVVKYQLSNDQNKIISKTTLAQAGELGEPTQGVWIKNDFHFIMNSPWGDYNQEGEFIPKTNTLLIGIVQ